MHVVIIGCGRVGSNIATQLSKENHDVVIVDKNPDAFRRLGENFLGRTVVGIGFDREILRSTGLNSNSAVIAVTSGDNSNILAARVAREVFGTDNVVARIYDPQRAEVYERCGISTVATVSWTSQQILGNIFSTKADAS